MTWSVAAVVAVLVTGVLVASGVSPASTAAIVAVCAVQVWAGALLWMRLSRRRNPTELLGMGIALGTVLALLGSVVTQALGLGAWGWVLPAVIFGVWWLVDRMRGRSARADAVEGVDRPTALALVLGAAVGLVYLGANIRNYPLTWTGTWSGYHTDMAFFEALATSIAHLGPMDSIFLPDAQVRYHWLTYGWAGYLTEATGAEPFVVLTRLLPALALAAAVALVASWARRINATWWVPSLAVALLLVGGFLGATYGGILNFDSPSQSMAVAWLLAFVIVLDGALDVRRSRPAAIGSLAIIGLLALALAGGKVSAAIPALAGALLVAVVAIARREPWRWTALCSAAITVAACALGYVLVLAGAAGSGGLGLFDLVDRASSQQGLNPVDGMRGVMLGTVIMVVAMAARWAGLAWLVVDRRTRWNPMTVVGIGMAAAGLLALVVFNGMNEIWFGLAAAAPLAVLNADGVARAVDTAADHDPRTARRLLVAGIAAAAVVFVVVWLLWATGASGGNLFVPTLRWAGPLVGVVLAMTLAALIVRVATGRWWVTAWVAMACVVLVGATAIGRLLGTGTGQVGVLQNGIRAEWFSIDGPFARDRDGTIISDWTQSQMDAAAWLRSEAEPGDVLATNLTLGAFVPGVTGLRTYVSALLYQAPYGRPSITATLLEREDHVWDFIEKPSASTAAPLCDGGVTWLWVHLPSTTNRDWSPFAETVRTSPDTMILNMTDYCGT